jgi:hypothetical protein
LLVERDRSARRNGLVELIRVPIASARPIRRFADLTCEWITVILMANGYLEAFVSAVVESIDRGWSRGFQLRVVQEVLLALLASEPSHGYQLRARLQLALGPLAESLNAGHVYVTLGRLEKSGLLRSERVEQSERPDRRAYVLTEPGWQSGWLTRAGQSRHRPTSI